MIENKVTQKNISKFSCNLVGHDHYYCSPNQIMETEIDWYEIERSIGRRYKMDISSFPERNEYPNNFIHAITIVLYGYNFYWAVITIWLLYLAEIKEKRLLIEIQN